jgi:flagellar protein FlaI
MQVKKGVEKTKRFDLKSKLTKLNPLSSLASKREPVYRPWFSVEPLAAVTTGKVLDKYLVDQAQVLIANNAGKGHYLVSEPPLNEREREIYRMLMEDIFYSLRPGVKVEDSIKFIEGAIWDSANDLGITEEVRAAFSKYRYYLIKDGFGYGKLHVPMMDQNVEEISVTSYREPVTVLHRLFTEFGWLTTNITFSSEEELRNFNQRLAQRTGKSLTTAIPVVDSSTKEGDRISLTFGDELTHPGSALSIRKYPREPYSLAMLINFGTLSPLIGAYLWEVMEFKGFPIILGELGSGKTSLLSAIIACIPPTMKICTVEDTLELQVPHANWLRMHTRTGYTMTETKFDVDLFDLVKLSLRHRPDYIIVGETRGEEIKALTHAAALGHSSASTFHAYSPEAALTRMRSPPMEVTEGGLMLIWCFVQMARVQMPDGKWVRRVTRIDEVIPGKELSLAKVFRWDPRRDEFTPDAPQKVVAASRRLRDAAESRGWTVKGLVEDMRRRNEFLGRLVKERKLGYGEFLKEIDGWYHG